MRISDWSSDVCSSDLEHEKFVYRRSDHRAPSYDEPGGIRDLLEALACCGQWQPVIEGGNAIALAGPDGTVSLEPAGQLELSGEQLETLHQTCSDAGRHHACCQAIGRASCRGTVRQDA